MVSHLATKQMNPVRFGDPNPDLFIPPYLSIVVFCFQLLAYSPCRHIFTEYFIKLKMPEFTTLAFGELLMQF